jgi:hypothetical protein
MARDQPRAGLGQGGGKGPVAPDAQLSKEEIDLLIFAPGFSTAASITNVSGAAWAWTWSART